MTYLWVLPVGYAWRNFPLLLLFNWHLQTVTHHTQMITLHVSNCMVKLQCIREKVIVLINAHLSCGRVQNWCRRRWRTTRDFCVCLKLWWLHWVLLCLHHSNDSLFGTGVVAYALLRWCVADILSRRCPVQCSDGQGSCNLLLDKLLESLSCLFCCLLHVMEMTEGW